LVIFGLERVGTLAHLAGEDARAPGGDARAPGRNMVQSCGTSLQSEWTTALPLSPLAPAPAMPASCPTGASHG